MISEHFCGFCEATVAVHAEPIAALAALKLASLALQSTHSPAMGFLPERRETSLIAPITRDPYEKCGLDPVSWHGVTEWAAPSSPRRTSGPRWLKMSVNADRHPGGCAELFLES